MITKNNMKIANLKISVALVSVISSLGMILYGPLSSLFLLALIALYYTRRTKNYLSFLAAIMIMTVVLIGSSLSQFLARFIYSFFTGREIRVFIDPLSTIIFIGVVCFVYMLGIVIIQNIYKLLSSFFDNLAFRLQKIVVFVTYIVFVVTYLSAHYIEEYKGIDTYLIMLLMIVAAMSIFVLLINYIGRQQLDIENKNLQLAQLNEYTNSMETMYKDMRSFRHDYRNVLSSLLAYAHAEDLEGIRNMLTKNLLPHEDALDYELVEINKLGNLQDVALKGLLYYKLSRGIQQGIKINLTILEQVNEINMDPVNLCRVIGILVDNAIEEALLTEEKYVHVLLEETEEITIIHTENSVTSTMPPIHDMFKEGFSTKESHEGIGLFNVRRILGESGISIETYRQNNHLIQMFGIRN